MRLRFTELREQIVAIEAVSGPLREQRDALGGETALGGQTAQS